MPYELTPEVTVRGLHEDAPGAVVLLPRDEPEYPWWSESTKAVLAKLATVDLEGKRFLDFGCGSGILGIAAAVEFGASPTFVEIEPRHAEACRANLKANGITAKVHREPPEGHWDFAVANVGEAVLVGQVSNLASHGVGTSREGELIEW